VQARVVSHGRHEEWIDGTYVGERNGLLVLRSATGQACEPDGPQAAGPTTENSECLIPRQSLRELRVPHGTHWKRGMAIGAAIGGAIDLAVLIAVSISFKGPYH
jgi:hypothetical protein